MRDGIPQPSSLFADRSFAILRDLDERDFDPWGVLFENEDGSATLHVFDRVEDSYRYRRDWPDFDAALGTLHRSVLISHIGKETGRHPKMFVESANG